MNIYRIYRRVRGITHSSVSPNPWQPVSMGSYGGSNPVLEWTCETDAILEYNRLCRDEQQARADRAKPMTLGELCGIGSPDYEYWLVKLSTEILMQLV